MEVPKILQYIALIIYTPLGMFQVFKVFFSLNVKVIYTLYTNFKHDRTIK